MLRPVARVKNSISDPGRQDWARVVSEVVVYPDFEEALDGIEQFSHLVVLFWMHKVSAEGRSEIKVHPQRRTDLPLVGVFATRSPARPNPLGISVVKLIERKGNILRVTGLDAIDGTPVVDIKPYLPGDSISAPRVADWVHKLG